MLGLKEDYKRQKTLHARRDRREACGRSTSRSRRAKHVQPIGQIGAGPFVGEEFPEVQKGRRRANRKPSPQGRAGDGLH